MGLTLPHHLLGNLKLMPAETQVKLAYLINRKRVVCVYGVIMAVGNVERIQEKIARQVFYRLLEYSLNIPQVHYHAINAQDEFFYFFYNISRGACFIAVHRSRSFDLFCRSRSWSRSFVHLRQNFGSTYLSCKLQSYISERTYD